MRSLSVFYSLLKIDNLIRVIYKFISNVNQPQKYIFVPKQSKHKSLDWCPKENLYNIWPKRADLKPFTRAGIFLGSLEFPFYFFFVSWNLIPSEPYHFYVRKLHKNCNRIESSQYALFFGGFSQGKSNDWKEIWLEGLEGIDCQSNVPNPWPELI